jgi:hypothetical protein
MKLPSATYARLSCSDEPVDRLCVLPMMMMMVMGRE